MLASARFKSTAVAVVLAVLMAAPLALLGAITLFLDVDFASGGVDMNVPASEQRMHSASYLVMNLLLISLCNVVWDSLKSRLDAS